MADERRSESSEGDRQADAYDPPRVEHLPGEEGPAVTSAMVAKSPPPDEGTDQ
jgi:hypothetical protein